MNRISMTIEDRTAAKWLALETATPVQIYRSLTGDLSLIEMKRFDPVFNDLMEEVQKRNDEQY